MNKFMEICEPVNKLIRLLTDKGFTIVKNELSDYHFNEWYVEMKGKNIVRKDIEVEGIKRFDTETFICNCHRSVLKIKN
jgi:hypothetical protein